MARQPPLLLNQSVIGLKRSGSVSAKPLAMMFSPMKDLPACYAEVLFESGSMGCVALFISSGMMQIGWTKPTLILSVAILTFFLLEVLCPCALETVDRDRYLFCE
jgi:hypothetical protein